MLSQIAKFIISKIKPTKIAKFLRINPQFLFDISIYHLSRFIKTKIDHNLIVLGGANGLAFMGNTKYLYKYLMENTNYKLYYIVKSKILQEKLENQGINTLFAYNLKTIKILRSAKAIFVTHGYFDILPVKLNPRTIAVQTWHGADIKIIGRHPYMSKYIKSIKSTLAGVRLRESQYFNYIITPSAAKKPREIVQKVFKFSPKRILSIGYPRNDILFSNEPDFLKNVKIFHQIPKRIARIILYAPTYRDIKTSKEPFDDKILSKLNELCKQTNTLFLMKAHINEQLISLKNLENISVVNKDADIQELLLITDILITDYSSVYCDYLLLNRPVLFYVYDYEEYVSQRGIYYDNLEEIAPGPLLYTPKELINAINDIEQIKNEFKQKSMKLNDYFNKYKDGFSSERLLKYLKLIK